MLADERPYAGSRRLDEDALRALLGRVCDRSPSLASAANHFALRGSDMAIERLGVIAVPALVIPARTTRCSRPRTARRWHARSRARDRRSATGSRHGPDEVLPTLVEITAG